MKSNILITSMGGYGSLSVSKDISLKLKKKINFFGTHNDYYLLKRAENDCKKIILVPGVKNKKLYIKKHLNLLKKFKIDYIVPNSDREVYVFSQNKKKILSKMFLPDLKDIKICQNKKYFLNFLKKYNFNYPRFVHVKSKSQIEKFLKNKKTKKFYIRITSETSEGAYGAAVLNNKKQLNLWLKIWKDFKNEKMSSFTLSEYLPGKVYENLLIFYRGELIISKVYENLKYHLTSNAITSAGSTPATAKSCGEYISKSISQQTSKIIRKLSEVNRTKPNGVYHSSVRLDKSNRPNITEINIGRFPSTNTIFNFYGKENITEIYFKILMGIGTKLKNCIDHDHGKSVIISRSLDQKPFVFREK